MPDIKIQMQEFSNETTFHGMKYVGGKQYSNVRRLIWCVMFLGMLSQFTVSFCEALFSYFRYESVTSQSLQIMDSLIMPSITVCPNYIINKQAIIQNYPEQADNIISYTQLLLTDNINYQDLPKDFIHFLQQENAIDFQIKSLSDGFIAGCRIQYRDIDCDNYTSSIITDRNACKTFNSKEVIKRYGSISLASAGQEFDVKLLLDLEQNDSLSSFLSGNGFTLLVHHPNNYPRMSANSFAVGPGQFVLVAIRQFEYEYLGTPYSATDCIRKDQLHSYNKYTVLGENYSQDSCLVKCFYDIIYDCDNCSLFTSADNYCNVVHLMTCVPINIQFVSYNKVRQHCAKCLPTCEEIMYDVRVSTMEYPNKFISNAIDSYDLPVNTQEEISERYALVSVYFGSTYNTVVSQRVAVNIWHVMSSIGGNLGLYLGASILSVIEFLDLICTLCMGKIGCLLWGKNSSKDHGSLDTSKVIHMDDSEKNRIQPHALHLGN